MYVISFEIQKLHFIRLNHFVKLITVLRRCNSHSSLLLNVVFLNYPLRSLPAVKMNACPTHSHHTMVDNFESRNQTESHTESQEASCIGHKSDDGNLLVSFDACDHWILKRGNRKKCFYFQNIFFCFPLFTCQLFVKRSFYSHQKVTILVIFLVVLYVGRNAFYSH